MKKIKNYKLIVIILILLTIIVYYFNDNNYSTNKMYDILNDNRISEINIIEDNIKAYYFTNKSYPKANTFKELQKYFPGLKNDVKYHYGYLSDSSNYMLTYPLESYEGIKCMKKSNNIKIYTESDINIKCTEVLARKRKNE